MSQNSLTVANGTGAAVRTALNNALDTLVTLNSGASAPSTTFAYMLWADTTTGLLKIRNAANSAWIVVGRLASIGLGRALNSSVAKSAAYTLVAADEGKVILGTATWTLTLTAAATLGDGFIFALVNQGVGTITIDPNASETIDGVATFALAAAQAVIVFCDGSAFRVVARQVVSTTGTGALVFGTSPTLTSPVIDTQVSGSAIATQAQMETATSLVTVVTPGRTQNHPGVAKAWVMADNGAGIQASYNVTSVTDTGVGAINVNLTTAFSSASLVIVANALHSGIALFTKTQALSATSPRIDCFLHDGAQTDPTNYLIAMFGDQ